MWKDPLTLYSEEHGCASCGKTGDVCYGVQLYFLPTKLVRKKHKAAEQTVIYCRGCFEVSPDLPVLIDGQTHSIAKVHSIKNRELAPCLVCGGPPPELGRISGLITSTLMAGGSCIENNLLGSVCNACCESHKIGLVRKINDFVGDGKGG